MRLAMWAAALSRSGKRCTRVSRGDARGREPPQPPGLASSPRLACLACPCICAGCCSDGCGRIDRSGRVLHHTSPSRTRGKTPQLHKASLLHLDVDRSNGCRTRGECWAAAGCVERTERVQLQRPPSICMLMHARARTKTPGNPDRGTRVPATKSCGLPRWQCVCIAVGAAAQVRMRATARCKYKIVSDISCDSARVQQQHDRYMTRARPAAVSLGGGSRPSVGLKTACLGLDCHEFSLAPSHA